ncbi:hypothetical protein FA13DRAFT_839244 [Coprinellus micaceus]|uniref:MYND-type domain-containing protein n=1 Tax=Coprinellus micaceus TaxID=71717 RepID=A0A4Y7S2E5_COPMI|nr:hypothetical protein FA13DRAFT_839244 [Coprinellus micaceus]
MIIQLVSSVSHLSIYPRLISPTSFGKVSHISAPVGAQAAACWGSFLKAFERAEAARSLLANRPPMHVCDNRLCGGVIGNPSARFKVCSGCSSTIYCSTSCQEQDWYDQHQRECKHARADHDSALTPDDLPFRHVEFPS